MKFELNFVNGEQELFVTNTEKHGLLVGVVPKHEKEKIAKGKKLLRCLALNKEAQLKLLNRLKENLGD